MQLNKVVHLVENTATFNFYFFFICLVHDGSQILLEELSLIEVFLIEQLSHRSYFSPSLAGEKSLVKTLTEFFAREPCDWLGTLSGTRWDKARKWNNKSLYQHQNKREVPPVPGHPLLKEEICSTSLW